MKPCRRRQQPDHKGRGVLRHGRRGELHPGTKVLLASGLAIAIASLRPGDPVLATNTRTRKTTAETVAAVLVHRDADRYDLTIKTAHGTAVIGTTRNHLFLDPQAARWVKASTLKYGTRLRTRSAGEAVVIGGSDPNATTGWMWDLTIPGDHDFYVMVATTAILVHNDGCGSAPEGATGQVEYGVRT